MSIALRDSRLPTLIACAALALALLPAGTLRAQKMPTMPPMAGTRVGNLAHDFTLKDLENQKHSLKELRGKQVVHVVFWATWCVPCMQEIPTLRTIQEKYKDKGVQILGITLDMNQTKDDVRAITRGMKINYPVLWDEGGEVQDRYQVEYIPQNFLIGKDGVIRYTGTSLPSNYETLLDSLLRGEGAARTASRQTP